MPEHLTHLAHSLSHCTELRRKAEKANDTKEAKYWGEIHFILTRACVAIGKVNYERVKNA